jgi:hypothetical protein
VNKRKKEEGVEHLQLLYSSDIVWKYVSGEIEKDDKEKYTIMVLLRKEDKMWKKKKFSFNN